ncbi:hypothetical protein F5X96DRAFT_613935 [Biscogniauxia mediterranea]|nr:hypothetical protein F5X96DRAFT_613935 [Biscogniauxia mediterranea]
MQTLLRSWEIKKAALAYRTPMLLLLPLSFMECTYSRMYIAIARPLLQTTVQSRVHTRRHDSEKSFRISKKQNGGSVNAPETSLVYPHVRGCFFLYLQTRHPSDDNMTQNKV